MLMELLLSNTSYNRLSPVWACSIYLFHHHIISFWRSHFTPVTAILGAARRNESNLRRNAAKRMPIKKSSGALQRSDQKGSIQTEGEEDELLGIQTPISQFLRFTLMKSTTLSAIS